MKKRARATTTTTKKNATNEEATSTRARYDDARTMIEDALKGDSDAKSIAAKCRACPGTLLLSAANMRAHAASKRHRKNLEKLGRANDETFVCFYPAVREDDGIVSDGEAETHAERLARLRAQKILRSAEGERAKGGKFSLDQFDSSGDEGSDDESDGDDDAKMTKRLAKKEFARKVSDSAPKEKEKRSRRHAQSKRKSGKSKPGKRQRMAMKSVDVMQCGSLGVVLRQWSIRMEWQVSVSCLSRAGVVKGSFINPLTLRPSRRREIHSAPRPTPFSFASCVAIFASSLSVVVVVVVVVVVAVRSPEPEVFNSEVCPSCFDLFSAASPLPEGTASVVLSEPVLSDPPFSLPVAPGRLHSNAGRGAWFFAAYNPHALHRDPIPSLSFLQNGVSVDLQLTQIFCALTVRRRLRPSPCAREAIASRPPFGPRDRLSRLSWPRRRRRVPCARSSLRRRTPPRPSPASRTRR